jgi:hypothetical protein
MIHQPTRFSCLACVAAMITGEPLEEIFEICGHDGSTHHFRFLDITGYLNRRGYHVGCCAADFAGMVIIPKPQPAIVIVSSSVSCGNHAVFWDGQDFQDPKPSNHWRTIFDYEIKEWWPIFRYVD